MAFSDWDIVASNNAVKPGINWSEGMAPPDVNNSARQMMADLAVFNEPNGTGAGLVKYKYSTATYGDGTVGRKIQAGALSPKEAPFNAKGDGVTDDTDALYNCAVACIVLSKEMDLGSGTYKVTSQKTITMPNPAVGPSATNFFAQLRVRGHGFDNTIINCTASGWLKIIGSSQQHSVHMYDFTVASGTTGTSTAIQLECTAYPFFGEWANKSHFRLHFRGNDGINNVKHWGIAVEAIDWSNIDFSHSMFDGASTPAGTGVVTRKSAGSYVCVFDFVGCHFRFLNQGYNYGTGSQTANFTGCFFAQNNTDIYAPAGGINHQGLSVTNCEFYRFAAGDGVYIACAVPNFVFHGNRMAVHAGYRGVAMDVADMTSICDNQFFPDTAPNTATAAIDINGTVAGSKCLVSGNNFASTTFGVRCLGGSASVTVTGSNISTPGMTLAMDIGTGNNIGYLSASPVVGTGYGKGAGAAVVQATSKGTPVTIDTPCGQITTSASTLASGAVATFPVSCAMMRSTDVVVVNVGNGSYSARAFNNTDGSFYIALKNETGGSLSDAVVINYAIIKANNA